MGYIRTCIIYSLTLPSTKIIYPVLMTPLVLGVPCASLWDFWVRTKIACEYYVGFSRVNRSVPSTKMDATRDILIREYAVDRA